MKLNKNASIFLGIFSAVACISSTPLPVSAATLNFDDLGHYSEVNSYNGFSFNNFHALDSLTHPNTGYSEAAVSPNNSIFNWFANPASVSSATAFTFNSAYITSAWNDGLQVTIQGSLGANQLFSQTITPSATAPTLYTFDWAGIDSLRFSSFGGTLHSGYNTGRGTHFALDNFTYNAAKPVPVPGVVFGVVVAAGLFGNRLLKKGSTKTAA